MYVYDVLPVPLAYRLCSDSEMIASSPKEEAGPEQEDIPEIGMEQDVAADPGDSKGLSLMMI